MELVYQPSVSMRLGDYLTHNLCPKWSSFRAAVAFVKRSGTRHIVKSLSHFSQYAHVDIIVGIDHAGSSLEGISDLRLAAQPSGRVVVVHNRLPFTFHPKIYVFKSPKSADVLIGSGNLTEGGLYTNYEAGVRLILDLTDPTHALFLQSIDDVLNQWGNLSSGVTRLLDQNLLERLVSDGLVLPEAASFPTTGDYPHVLSADPYATATTKRPLSRSADLPFAAQYVPPAPKPPTASTVSASVHRMSTIPILNFVMTLQRTDIGVGQTSKGTSRRSPEIFIPLSARDAVPEFWEWPGSFTTDQTGKADRSGVRVRLGADTVLVNMMTWPLKHDFRLRCEALRSAGNVGDILHLEKVSPDFGFEYFSQIIPRGTSQYLDYLSRCDTPVRNSKKMFGYF